MTSLLPYITGSGGALVVLAIFSYLFYAGKLHSDAEFRRVEAERDEYLKALQAERQAVNETAAAGAVTNQLLGAIVSLAADHRGVPAPQHAPPTAEDLGL